MGFARRLRVGGVALVAVSALFLASCSDGGSTPEPSKTEGATTQAVQKNQTLRLSITTPPGNFSIGNWSGGDSTPFLSVYDTVLHMSVAGKIEPGIAEKWEYNDDLTELTLHIRSGLKFTDGEALDAQAVSDSMNASIALPGAVSHQDYVDSVSAPDASTVVIKLNRPSAALLGTLAGVHGAVGAPQALTSESSKTQPVGSGPYIMDLKKTVAESKYVYTRNPDYYDLESYPYSDLEISVIGDATAAMNAVQAGQLDFTTLRSADQLAQFPESKFSHGNLNPNAVGAIFFVDREGMVVPALKDKRVRQAINMAFDRQAIAQGLGPGTMTATDQMFSPIYGSAYNAGLEDTYAFNVEKAKSLLAEAGYPDGFDVTMPSTIVSQAFEPLISQALSDIGIKVNWEAVPFQDFYTKVFGLNYGMFYMVTGFSGNDPQDADQIRGGAFNPFQLSTPEFDKLLNQANTVEDGSGFGPVNSYLVDEAWYAPIVRMSSPYVVPNTVAFTPPVVNNTTVLPFAPATN